MPPTFSPEEIAFVTEAAQFLEHPSFFIRTASKLGQPVEFLEKKLPDKAKALIHTATRTSLEKALSVALKTMPDGRTPLTFAESTEKASQSNLLHLLGTAVTGTIGGFFGTASLPVELPLTTTLMMRAIAQNAKNFGADLSSAETQLECLYVFTLGTPSSSDDAADSTYYASRFGLSQLISQAASFLAKHTSAEIMGAIQKGSAPVLVRFIAAVASKFEIAVSEKIISEALPIVGAAGGAMINTAFTHHFAEAAKYHFGLKKLERKYGESAVRALYASKK